MNNQSLERLLIDRAFGQLSPEAEELLLEELTRNEAAARMAEEITSIVGLAEVSLRRPAPSAIGHHLPAIWSGRERTKRALAMAASFAVGAAGAVFGLRALSPSPSQEVGVVKHEAGEPRGIVDGRVEHAVRTLPFWSNERIYVLASAAKQSSSGKQQP